MSIDMVKENEEVKAVDEEVDEPEFIKMLREKFKDATIVGPLPVPDVKIMECATVTIPRGEYRELIEEATANKIKYEAEHSKYLSEWSKSNALAQEKEILTQEKESFGKYIEELRAQLSKKEPKLFDWDKVDCQVKPAVNTDWDEIKAGTKVMIVTRSATGSEETVVKAEGIFIGYLNGKVYALSYDGSTQPAWPHDPADIELI